MTVLSQSEVEELLEHLRARPDIWIEHNDAFIRKAGQEDFGLVMKVRNGLPKGMYALSHKALAWSETTSSDYVRWLLEKYTAYGLRYRVILTLAGAVKPTADVDALSRDICELQGGPFVRKHERSA